MQVLASTAMDEQRSRFQADSRHTDVAIPLTSGDQRLGVLVGRFNFSPADEIAGIAPRMLAAGLGVALLAGLFALAIARYIAVPLRNLTGAAVAIGGGNLATRIEVRHGGEIGALANAFNQMVVDLHQAQQQVAEQQRTLEQRVAERTAELEQAVEALRESVSARDELSATLREISSPVVPVLDGILVMPLVGAIDTDRARLLMSSLLRAIEEHHADMVIMDVTGVPVVDAQIARVFVDVADAARLLGAQPILVGIHPEVAQTLVGLGLDLKGLTTRADLQSGVDYAIRQRRNGRGKIAR
jgi:anti-anti-sigma regulatory factor/HAMP domain-containing protein